MHRMKTFGIALATLVFATTSANAGLLYAINDSGSLGNNVLVTIDPITFAVTTIGATGAGGDFGDLAYNAASDTLYWIAGRGNNNLYTLDKATGAATLVGSHGIDDLFALAYNSANGKLYAQSTAGIVYTLDPTTGVATSIGSSTTYPGGYTYRSDTNQLIGLGAGSGLLEEIDPTTGAATLLADLGFINDNDLAYDPDLNVYWVADWSNNLYKFDATTFAGGVVADLRSPYDGIVYVGARTLATPEPSTILSAGIALVAALALRRRGRSLA